MGQYILPALGVTFLVPLILLLVFYKGITEDAAAAIAGAMVAYFFEEDCRPRATGKALRSARSARRHQEFRKPPDINLRGS